MASDTEGDTNTGDLRSWWLSTHVGASSSKLLQRDEAVFVYQSLSTPCLTGIVEANGCEIVDADGKRFLDFHGNSVHQLGHGHPTVVQAVCEQLARLPFCPRRFTNEPVIRFAEELIRTAPPGLTRVLFTPGGATSVSTALKIARLATGRFKTISMWDSFHGATLDAASVGGEATFREGLGPLLPGTEHVPPPDPIRCPLLCGSVCNLACASYLEYVLEREGDVAAVVAEPIRCTTVVAPPASYWHRIRSACHRHGALLIFDEIPTGLGRTGRMWASYHTGVEPDILVLGKGLGGGIIPISSVLVREELSLRADKSIGHYTHEKNPVGAAAGLATLQVLEDEGLVARSKTLGDAFGDMLRQTLSPDCGVREVRNLGMLVGVEVESPSIAERALYRSLERGLSFKVSLGTVLTLSPPLNIPESRLFEAAAILEEALAD